LTQILLILGVAVVGLAFVLLVGHRRQWPTVVAITRPRAASRARSSATAFDLTT
jgi:hypothetical protein